MPIQSFRARVSDSKLQTEKFWTLNLELIDPPRLSFQAGQYIILSIPGIDQKRNYSIASSPAIDHAIELLIDISPAGPGSTYLKNLKPGDEVQFMAPAGQFTFAQPDSDLGKEERAIVFIATGSGITPLRSMILDQLQNKKDTRPMTLYWGLRHEKDFCWLEDFEELMDSFKNFQFHPVLSQASEEWSLCRGHVTDCLGIHALPEQGGYYLCGNKRMIEDTQNILIGKSVKSEHIHFEKFY